MCTEKLKLGRSGDEVPQDAEAEQPDHPASLGDSITASYSDEVFGAHRRGSSRVPTGAGKSAMCQPAHNARPAGCC